MCIHTAHLLLLTLTINRLTLLILGVWLDCLTEELVALDS